MNLIINFSAREKGNCGAIAEFIKKRGDMVIHYKNLHTHRCSDCEYESVCRENANTGKMTFTHYTKVFSSTTELL